MDLQSIPYFMATRFTTDPWLPVLLVLLVIALVRTVFLSVRLSRFTKGGDGKSLEGVVHTLLERTKKLEEHAALAERALNNLDARIASAIRGSSVVKYDPFEGAGGQQSFSASLIDEQGTGVLISGIHARDSVRVYAKEIVRFDSKQELSKDEKESLAAAQQKLKQP